MTNIPVGRYPLVEVYVGDPKTIFEQFRGTFVYDNLFYDEWERIQPRAITSSLFVCGGCVTLFPRDLVENTRLSGGRKRHLDPVAKAFRDQHYVGTMYDYGADNPLWLDTGIIDAPDRAGITGVEYFRHSLEHYMKVQKAFTVWTSTATMQGTSVLGADVVAKLQVSATPSSWVEAVPDSYPACIRAAQLLPVTENTTTGNWVLTKLQSDIDSHGPNPSLLFEIERKPQSQAQTQSAVINCTKYALSEEDGSLTAEAASVTLDTPMVVLSIADGTNDEIAFQFVDGQSPVAIQAKDKQRADSPTLVCRFDADRPIRISLRWAPPGYYIVESDCLTEPWVVSFYTPEGKTQFIHSVPAGKIGAAFLGMGQVTVAFAPYRYFPVGAFSTPPIDRGFSDSLSGGFLLQSSTILPQALADAKDRVITSALDTAVCSVNTYVMVPPGAQFPTGDHRKTDKKLKATEFRVGAVMQTTDTTQTPYVYRTPVTYIGKADPKDPTRHRIGDKGDAKYGTTHVKAFSITTTPENFWRTKRSGSITFTNNNGEWDYMLPANGEQTPKTPVQQAITIYFKWLDIPGETVDGYDPASLAHYIESQKTGGAFFTPGTDDQYAVFTGWLTGLSVSAEIGRSTVTGQLAGRWHQLEERKILNSPYYDGTGWGGSIKDLLKFGGLSSADIDMTSFDASELADYTVPMDPMVAQKPRYKFAFGTNVESGFNELHNLVHVFCFEKGSGSIIFKMPQDVIKAAPVTFYDAIADAPDDAQHSAYYALSPFTYTRDSKGVYNWFLAGGPNIDGNARLLPEVAVISDAASIMSAADPPPDNYVGYKKEFLFVKPWLSTDRARTDMVIKHYYALRYAPETVSWTSPLVTLEPYTRVQFQEHNRHTIPTTRIFWLQSNTMSFDAASRSATSTLQARTIRGIVEGLS